MDMYVNIYQLSALQKASEIKFMANVLLADLDTSEGKPNLDDYRRHLLALQDKAHLLYLTIKNIEEVPAP